MNILEYENYQEKKNHYNKDLPYNTYLCSIPLDFPSVPLHWHNEMELIYIKKGNGSVSVDLNTYMVRQGNIIVIAPGQLHSIDSVNNSRMEYENIIFDLNILLPKQEDLMSTDIINSIMKKSIVLPTFIEPSLPYYNDVISCIDKADTVCKSFPDGYTLALRGYLYEFFFLLYTNAGQKKTPKPVRNLDKIKLITKYIEEHYAEEISIETMANICGFSSSHFMKFFKNNMGISFTAYLNDYRLLLSSKMLLSSNDTILTIAGECGFNNLSFFNRQFKNKYNMTPSEFKRFSAGI